MQHLSGRWMKALNGIVIALSLVLPGTTQAQSLESLVNVQGIRENQLVGYSLVVGLDGTGDKNQVKFTNQTITNMLRQFGVQLPSKIDPKVKNVAAVAVSAMLPPMYSRGQTIDVTVSSIGDAKSLRGGTLLMTPLKGVDSQVYALAQGNILVGGAGASAGGSSVQVNQLNGGRITNGAIIERELPTQFGAGNTINLQLNNEDFTMAQQIADTINRSRGYGNATALDARTVQIRTSTGSSNQVRMLADIQNMEVNVPVQDAKVIINSRTGSVVMNQKVALQNCAVSHGSLTVTVTNEQQVSQPNPFGQGQTAVTNKGGVDIKQDGGNIFNVKGGTNLADVVKALNTLGANPLELIAILQAMKASGALRAELEVI